MALRNESSTLSNGKNDGNTPATENWCVTDVKVIKCNCKWTINNLSFFLEDPNAVLLSSPFSAAAENEIQWCLRIKLTETQKDYLPLYLVYLSSSSSNLTEVRTKFKFCILNEKGEETNVRTIDKTHKFQQGTDWGFQQFVKRDSLFDAANGLLVDDKLTLLCEVSMYFDTVSTSSLSKVNLKVPECRLSEDLGDLLNSERFSDITLAVGDKEFKAHKAILAARSPVFAAMFEHDMEEKKNNRVNITDVDHETLRELLHFIYTGRAANVDKIANRLLSASDKYALERLKVICEEALCQCITVENAADSLILADLHSADQLKAAIISFINKNQAADVLLGAFRSLAVKDV